ncbi:hypothetical protein [Zeaxanthinibacter enoshimensis]|nr:hypothetical protein [Zeaxanthinibacter enoshimensis]
MTKVIPVQQPRLYFYLSIRFYTYNHVIFIAMVTADTNNLPDSSHRPNWKKSYILANHWKSDLDFYREELRHLHHIINSYSIWIVKEDNQHLLESMESKLYRIRSVCEELIHKVGAHIMEIGQFVEKDEITAPSRVAATHHTLEQEIAAFVKSYRECRKDLFSNTEVILDNEKEAARIFRS